jgi:hypothetical protein
MRDSIGKEPRRERRSLSMKEWADMVRIERPESRGQKRVF